MASKTKMRCATCGKWFQSANAKDTLCPDCTQKARKEKLAAKAAPLAPTKATGVPTTPPPPKPKPKPEHTHSGTSSWLDSVDDVKIGQPEPTRPKIISSPTPRPPRPEESRDRENSINAREGAGNTRDGGNRVPNREGTYHPANSPYRVGGGSGLPDAGPRPRQPMEGGFNRSPRPDRPPRSAGYSGPKGGKSKVKVPKPPPPPKPKKEKIEPPKPFEPTEEQIQQVEARYLELATPIEFDGIRTQIATELQIPKKAVKKIIKDLRDRQQIPSWWDAQTFKGSEEDLAKIRAAYEPLLPLPNVGVHKKIAEDLSLKPVDVYQAIKQIRTEMGLPQYNDPELHPELKELEEQRRKDREAKRAAAEAAKAQQAATSETPPAETQPAPDEPAATTQEQPAAEATPVPVPTGSLDGTDTGTIVEETKEKADAGM